MSKIKTNKTRTIYLRIATNKQVAKEFITAYKNIAEGKHTQTKETLTFSNSHDVLFALTSSRYELLKELHGMGETSIKALSQSLKKDYHSVHHDVKILEKIGLITNQNGKISTEWANVVVELPLINTNIIKTNNRTKHKKVS